MVFMGKRDRQENQAASERIQEVDMYVDAWNLTCLMGCTWLDVERTERPDQIRLKKFRWRRYFYQLHNYIMVIHSEVL